MRSKANTSSNNTLTYRTCNQPSPRRAYVPSVSTQSYQTCTDPEMFVRGGPTLCHRGRGVQDNNDSNTTTTGPSSTRQRNANNVSLAGR